MFRLERKFNFIILKEVQNNSDIEAVAQTSRCRQAGDFAFMFTT